MEVTDEWLYIHMPKAEAAIIKDLESKIDTTYQFSRHFERRMKMLIWKESHPWLWSAAPFIKRIAVFCIGIIGILFLLTMSVEAYRLKFFETVKTFWKDSVEYTYFTDLEIDKIQQYREPGYLPEGYREVDRISGDTMLNIVYENDNGEQIIWQQTLGYDGSSIVMDSEYNSREIKEINGVTVTFDLYDDGFIGSYYEYEECIYILSTENLEIEEIYLMLESIIDTG